MARDIIVLECKNCGNRNYATTKNKKLHQERLVLRKYCKHCRKHTEHKEVK